MSRVVYEGMVLVDTSGIIALLDPSDKFHDEAIGFLGKTDQVSFFTVNVTSHELFTRVRYDKGLPKGLDSYDYLRGVKFNVLTFDEEHEKYARGMLEKYKDQKLSFHDVLCAAVMMTNRIYRVFSFDRHFSDFGFQVLPGRTR